MNIKLPAREDKFPMVKLLHWREKYISLQEKLLMWQDKLIP